MLSNLPPDLIRHVLLDRVGLWTFTAFLQTCRCFWRLGHDEELLRSAVRYVGGVTQTQLCHLLRVSRPSIVLLTPLRRTRCCVVYSDDTVIDVLRSRGGTEGRAARKVPRRSCRAGSIYSSPYSRAHKEQLLHEKELRRRVSAVGRQ